MHLWLYATGILARPFYIKINPSAYISDIATKASEANRDLGSPANLQLRRATGINLVHDDIDACVQANFDNFPVLKEALRIGQSFPDPHDDSQLHVVVSISSQSLLGTCYPSRVCRVLRAKTSKRPRSSDSDEVAEVVNAARRRAASSSAAMASEIAKIQVPGQLDAVFNFRPLDLAQPPIEIWHPVFAKLKRLMAVSPEKLSFTHEQLENTLSFMQACLKYYENERARQDAIRHFLKSGQLLVTEVLVGKKSILTDGSESVSLLRPSGGNMQAYTALVELKNEIGEGRSDPTTQAERDYVTICASTQYDFIRAAGCCPAFLIGIAGPYIMVSGAVFAQRFISERLTDYMFIGPSASSTRSRVDIGTLRITQLLSALNECLGDLERYYEALFPQPPVQLVRWRPYFQSFTTADNTNIRLEYIKRLCSDSPAKAVFQAKAKDETGKERLVVVKFTSSYNPDAHALLARQRLASELLFSKRHDDAGGLYVIVMDYIETAPTATLSEGSAAAKDIEEALDALHGQGLVFGDLREPNVLISKDGRAKLIDFDWCGKNGEAQYPSDINLDSMAIKWHPDVRRAGKVKPEHDLFMFNKLIGRTT